MMLTTVTYKVFCDHYNRCEEVGLDTRDADRVSGQDALEVLRAICRAEGQSTC